MTSWRAVVVRQALSIRPSAGIKFKASKGGEPAEEGAGTCFEPQPYIMQSLPSNWSYLKLVTWQGQWSRPGRSSQKGLSINLSDLVLAVGARWRRHWPSPIWPIIAVKCAPCNRMWPNSSPAGGYRLVAQIARTERSDADWLQGPGHAICINKTVGRKLVSAICICCSCCCRSVCKAKKAVQALICCPLLHSGPSIKWRWAQTSSRWTHAPPRLSSRPRLNPKLLLSDKSQADGLTGVGATWSANNYFLCGLLLISADCRHNFIMHH